MTISICGDNKYKKLLINKICGFYKDKVVVCDYFYIKFNSIIDTEKYKYKLLDCSDSLESARIEYDKIVYDTVNKRMDDFLEKNKDNIIILTNDNILTKDFYDTKYFVDSDIKVLITYEKKYNEYKKEIFDIVIDNIKDIDLRKLVRVYE